MKAVLPSVAFLVASSVAAAAAPTTFDCTPARGQPSASKLIVDLERGTMGLEGDEGRPITESSDNHLLSLWHDGFSGTSLLFDRATGALYQGGVRQWCTNGECGARSYANEYSCKGARAL